MAAYKLNERQDYCSLPENLNQNDAVRSHHTQRVAILQRHVVFTVFLVSLAAILTYIFWPSDPRLEVVRLKITHVHIHRKPVVSIDMSLLVGLKVSNSDVYSLDYTRLDVAIGYRGKTLGHVTSENGHVGAMGSSYVDAETELDGVGVFSDVVHLLRDLANGSVKFDTVTDVNGRLGIFFFGFPLKVKLACGILINTVNQTISRQKCYPDLSHENASSQPI